jgi:hypothetical protein
MRNNARESVGVHSNLVPPYIRPLQEVSSRFWRYAVVVSGGAAIAACAVGVIELPSIGAQALLHPARHPVTSGTPAGCITRTLAVADAALTGWICEARAQPRGTLVYLHGVADNRQGGLGIIQRFVPLGFTVVAYDSRAHGDSTGDACTYGYFERDDLYRILDTVRRSDRSGRQLTWRRRGVAGSRSRSTCDGSRRDRAVLGSAEDRGRTGAGRIYRRDHRPRVRARRSGRPFPRRRSQSGCRRALDHGARAACPRRRRSRHAASASRKDSGRPDRTKAAVACPRHWTQRRVAGRHLGLDRAMDPACGCPDRICSCLPAVSGTSPRPERRPDSICRSFGRFQSCPGRFCSWSA